MIQTWLQTISSQGLLVILPLVGSMLCFVFPKRVKSLGLIVAIAIVAGVFVLSMQVSEQGVLSHSVGGWAAPLGIDLYTDSLSLLMLLVTALVGLAISIYSTSYFSNEKSAHFWPLWMLLWAALNALFLSSDLFNIYVTLELLGLSAVALVALAGGVSSLGAAMRYLFVNLLGSLFYLLGLAFLYHSFSSVDMLLLAQRMETTPAVLMAMGLMTAGLLLKSALFPLHFWLPPAHSTAPAPVSALLSGLVVKASFFILLRLWLDVFPPPDVLLSQLLGLLGAIAVIWGGVQALCQTRLKMLIAYSTVAQLGYLFIAFSLATVMAWKAVIYLLISHALAKSAMFLVAGNLQLYGKHDQISHLDRVAQRLPMSTAAFALAGVSIMGLPPSGGFIGKWVLLESAFRSGQWWWVVVLVIGSLLGAAYIFKVIGHVFNQSEVTQEVSEVPRVMEWVALSLALAAILLGFTAPWILDLMDIGLPFAPLSEVTLSSGVSR